MGGHCRFLAENLRRRLGGGEEGCANYEVPNARRSEKRGGHRLEKNAFLPYPRARVCIGGSFSFGCAARRGYVNPFWYEEEKKQLKTKRSLVLYDAVRRLFITKWQFRLHVCVSRPKMERWRVPPTEKASLGVGLLCCRRFRRLSNYGGVLQRLPPLHTARFRFIRFGRGGQIMSFLGWTFFGVFSFPPRRRLFSSSSDRCTHRTSEARSPKGFGHPFFDPVRRGAGCAFPPSMLVRLPPTILPRFISVDQKAFRGEGARAKTRRRRWGRVAIREPYPVTFRHPAFVALRVENAKKCTVGV